MSEIENEVVDTTTTTSVEEAPVEENIIDGELSDVVEFDDSETVAEVVEPLVYDKVRVADDGSLGIPIFDDKELRILERNLGMTADTINGHQSIMREMLEAIKGEQEEDPNADIKDKVSVYNSSYNILVELQKGVDGYIDFVTQNKEEILSFLNNDVMETVKNYISDCEKEFNITYKDKTLKSFITAVAIKRLLNAQIDGEKDLIDGIFTAPKGLDFDDVVLKIMSPMSFFVSNISGDSVIENPGFEERELMKIASGVIGDFMKYKITTCENANDVLDARELLTTHVINLSNLIGKKSVYTFIKMRSAYMVKLKQHKKQYGKEAKLPLHPNLVKQRFHAAITENVMKSWFSSVMFSDRSVMENKEEFFKKLNDTESYTALDVFKAIVTTYSYRFLFSELAKIIEKTTVSINRSLTSHEMATIKNYLAFVALYKESADESSEDYGISDLYNTYLGNLLDRLVKERS